MNVLLCVESGSPSLLCRDGGFKKLVGLKNLLHVVVGPHGEEIGQEQNHLVVTFLIPLSSLSSALFGSVHVIFLIPFIQSV